jgi:uncharacterized membrane protein
LSTFATSMVSLTSLVLTVTLVTVQLAMGQFSPRIVHAGVLPKVSAPAEPGALKERLVRRVARR